MSGARSLADRARYFRGARRLVLQEGRRVGTEQRGVWGSQSISNRPLLNPSPYRRGLFSLIMPNLLNYIVAIYLIVVGLIGLNDIYHFIK